MSPMERTISPIHSSSQNDPKVIRLVDTLFNFLPKDLNSSYCYDIALEYRKFQELMVNRLYRSINKNAPEGETEYRYFERLCQLHMAIEELWFPYPKQFKEQITNLGYKCLDKTVFLQFLAHGIFEITASFVEGVMSQIGNTEEERQFKYLLFSKLPEEDSIRLLSTDHSPVDKSNRDDFVLDNKLQKHKVNYKSDVVDMEGMVSADFLPLAIYLDCLKIGNIYSESELVWMSRTAEVLHNQSSRGEKDSTVVFPI